MGSFIYWLGMEEKQGHRVTSRDVAAGRKLRDLPAAGVLLVVRSRFDSDMLPPDRILVCAGLGAGVGGSAEFQLYNLTGEGTAGTHYDPLFPEAVALD